MSRPGAVSASGCRDEERLTAVDVYEFVKDAVRLVGAPEHCEVAKREAARNQGSSIGRVARLVAAISCAEAEELCIQLSLDEGTCAKLRELIIEWIDNGNWEFLARVVAALVAKKLGVRDAGEIARYAIAEYLVYHRD